MSDTRERPISVTIFAILNIGFGLMGLLGLLLESPMLSQAGHASIPSFASVTALLDKLNSDPAYGLWRHISLPLDGLAYLALMAAGVGLFLLKNWARQISLIFAGYKVLHLLLDIVMLIVAIGPLMQKTLEAASGLVTVLLAVGALVGLALSLAYPGLLLFYLTRPRVRAAFEPATAAPPPWPGSAA